jgi:hypothetical protein
MTYKCEIKYARSSIVGKKDKSLRELKESLGQDLSAEERAYLSSVESNLKNQIDYDKPEEVEAEIRRREREKLEKNYRPRAPLYGPRLNNKSGKDEGNDTDFRHQSYQQDPRYKAYYDRLRKDRADATKSQTYDDEVEAISMDDLEKRGYDKVTAPQKPAITAPPKLTIEPTPAPQVKIDENVTTQFGVARPDLNTPAARRQFEFASGAILRLDDGSIAIFKEPVSGKDYALLYFLQPDTTVVARGVFLQEYEVQRIGHLPEILMAEVIGTGRWDRDAVIYHLEKFDFAKCVRQVALHQEGRVPSSSRTERSSGDSSVDVRQSSAEDTNPPTVKNMLQRGRVLRINVGGKIWESVYWTKDEIGQIVAHDTNKEWALMHLDLSRFKDCIEYGDLLTGARLQEIERSLAKE